MITFDLQRVRAIGFDLDHTLHRRDVTFARFLDEACKNLPPDAVDRAEVARLDDRGYGDKRALLAYLAPKLGWSETTYEARYERFVEANLAATQPDTGLLAMLKRLAARYRLGVVSNGRARYQRAKLARLELTPFFDPVVISEEVGDKKPARVTFAQLTHAWALPADTIAFLGDDPTRDVEGARSSGMQALWVSAGRWPLDTPAPLSIPDVLALEALLPP